MINLPRHHHRQTRSMTFVPNHLPMFSASGRLTAILFLVTWLRPALYLTLSWCKSAVSLPGRHCPPIRLRECSSALTSLCLLSSAFSNDQVFASVCLPARSFSFSSFSSKPRIGALQTLSSKVIDCLAIPRPQRSSQSFSRDSQDFRPIFWQSSHDLLRTLWLQFSQTLGSFCGVYSGL